VDPEVFVIERNDGVVRLVSRMLHRAGFRTTSASSVEEALKALRQFERPPFAMVVAGSLVSSRDLVTIVEACEVGDRRPGLVVVSGDCGKAAELGRGGAAVALCKPFTASELLRALDAALAAAISPPRERQ
jgi:DNA-binding NtrC family response regulator